MANRNLWLLVVVALPGCALAAPFDPALLPDSNSEPSTQDRGPGGPDVDAGTDELGSAQGNEQDAGSPEGNTGDADAGVDNLAGGGGACTLGETRACYPGALDEADRGICRFGTQLCVDQDGAGVWGECDGARVPAREECGNGLDENCDGQTDEGCAEPEVVWCYFCSGMNLGTDFGACAMGSVPANADGACPAGSSRDMPECEPCLSCTIVQGFCETPECCGDWANTQQGAPGCQCWACPGQGTASDTDTAVAIAEQAGTAFCEYMPEQYDSACGDSSNGCVVRSCGAAAACL